MRLKQKLIIWLLVYHRNAYLRQKKLSNLEVANDSEFLDLHLDLLREDHGVQTFCERYNLYSLLKSTAHLQGAIAEAGVYQGGSAKLLCRIKGDAPLYLFDTFEGMPTVDKNIDIGFAAGNFAKTSLEQVRSYLKDFKNVHFYKGFFPASAIGQEPERQTYRFVHLDLDIYQSTLEALRFFYPRLVKGGILVSHDYGNISAPGVKKAFQEFFAGKNEPIIPLWETQCLVVKT